MRAIDKGLIVNIMKGAFACFNAAHPDLAIPDDRWGRVGVRAAGMLLFEIRRRCANLADQIVAPESIQSAGLKKNGEAA
jgi:hypothetical protein